MQYTEEHYAEMYNNLPEGLKDLVLSGRLAILVSAIGSRHGLNADQIADLEPAIEDVCLGLVTIDELVDNILKNVQVDQRVANRIAAEAEIEILKPFGGELIIARKQKEDLDAKISKATVAKKPISDSVISSPVNSQPQDVSGHAQIKKVEDWYNKTSGEENIGSDNTIKKTQPVKNTFDWDTDFAKKPEPVQASENTPNPSLDKEGTSAASLETKLDVLTESINKLVNVRFGSGEKKDEGLSVEMQELTKRLEQAEQENRENKKLIQSLKGVKPVESIFGKQIPIDKQRKVDIDHTETKAEDLPKGPVQVTSVSKQIPIVKEEQKVSNPPIITSSVSKDTLDSIVETRNKITPLGADANQSTKKVLSLDELISKGDAKIKDANQSAKTATLIFPGLNDEKKIDIKNISQKDTLRQTLLDDLEFIKNNFKNQSQKSADEMTNVQTKMAEKTDITPTTITQSATDTNEEETKEEIVPVNTSTSTTTNLFKEELLPKTKEERMNALQEKIKALNKGVSSGGKTNISASSLDPYKL